MVGLGDYALADLRDVVLVVLVVLVNWLVLDLEG